MIRPAFWIQNQKQKMTKRKPNNSKSSGTSKKVTKSQSKKITSKWQKMLTAHASWKKDEILSVVHWIRQAFAIICGIIWGILGISGLFGVLM